MAQAVIKSSQLRLAYDLGVDGEGKQLVKTKNYNNVDTAATPDQLHTVAQAIASLQTYPIYEIERNDSHLIGE
ncbi:DUF1659 domain-containing protein [Metabacillus arenae]|uniref:DUF1659 domain-containing protein n=1 Tax=Metabacillus arenae TaxID=2771434 RepID=A0A926RYS6_9BACI|nr:DUF1659 domain-containing protein [Metabacillus arenae]MBD1383283.1 DUF1659 domain-containing protein [Metabacillus arenae]